jgi:hypothetical protein
MQKRGVFTFILCLIVAGNFFLINSTSLFYSFNGKNEVYLGYNSSASKIVSVKGEKVKNFISKKGEAIFIENEKLSPIEVMERFNAKLIFIEQIEEGVSYYAYSKDIKYVKRIRGEKINLHVFIGEKGTKIGSPIIYGSF